MQQNSHELHYVMVAVPSDILAEVTEVIVSERRPHHSVRVHGKSVAAHNSHTKGGKGRGETRGHRKVRHSRYSAAR